MKLSETDLSGVHAVAVDSLEVECDTGSGTVEDPGGDNGKAGTTSKANLNENKDSKKLTPVMDEAPQALLTRGNLMRAVGERKSSVAQGMRPKSLQTCQDIVVGEDGLAQVLLENMLLN